MVSLIDEAWRLVPFVPPFQFSAFFSPEDTLLCVCAAEAARRQLAGSVGESSDNALRIAELTAGSGLVGLHLLLGDLRATLLGLDIDNEAAEVAARNARALGLSDRSKFAQSDLWSAGTLSLLRTANPQLLVCNPPYVPEPPGSSMKIEAGAGAHGTAHLLRALELTRIMQPDALALSWCSLSDPAAIVAAAEDAGYELHDLFVTAIADGEYSGTVHWYLRDLENCYINEHADTLAVVASDGAARFAYLLFAGAFRRRPENSARLNDVADAGSAGRQEDTAEFVRTLCEDFARDGLRTIAEHSVRADIHFAEQLRLPPLASRLPPPARFTLHCSVLDRWDELQLRVMLHGEAAPHASTT